MYTLYLNISDFNIKIVLKRGGLIYYREIFKKNIITYYRSFSLLKKPKRIDYSITFISKKDLELVFNKRNNRTYINFYEKSRI